MSLVLTEADEQTEFGDPAYPELPNESGTYTVRSLWRVVEWRNKQIFRTTFVRHYWHPLGEDERYLVVSSNDVSFVTGVPSNRDVEKWLTSGQPTIVKVK
jgi:hypothetical protein